MKFRLKWTHKPTGKNWFSETIFDNIDSAKTVVRSHMNDKYYRELYDIVPVPIQESGERNGESRD